MAKPEVKQFVNRLLEDNDASLRQTKVSWVRNPDAPPGRPAKGRLRCPCGNAPETDFNASQGDVHCDCGAVYSWDGWVKKPSPGVRENINRLLEDEESSVVVPEGDAAPSVVNALLGDFLDGYIQAALFAETDNANDQGGESLYNNYSREDIDEETLRKMEADARAFLTRFGNIIPVSPEGASFSWVQHAGHDFWLTRNGHGAGFWDGDWENVGDFGDVGDLLTTGSEEFGQVDLYIGDDGRIHQIP